MAKKPLLLVTPGDPDGTGPEIVWKTLRNPSFWKNASGILCIGAREPFDRLGARVVETSLEQVSANPQPPRLSNPFVWLIPAPSPKLTRAALAGYQSGWSIKTAVSLLQKGVGGALTTGPINKDRLNLGGFPYPGHTEFLGKLCKTKRVIMMLANSSLRVSLVTTHLALKDVSKNLTHLKIEETIQITADQLRRWWGIEHPKIAVTALNPHAGENGRFGREEIEIISPAIKKARSRGKLNVTGPYPADTLFAKHAASHLYDAVVCMYHDQGLIPVKLLDFPNTVNVSLGLPIIRTSVDHGVGFDIAGKNLADPSSFQAAVRMAIKIEKGVL